MTWLLCRPLLNVYTFKGGKKKLIRKNRKWCTVVSLLFSSTCDGEDQWRPRRWRHPAHLRSIRARVVNVTVPSHFAILCETCFLSKNVAIFHHKWIDGFVRSCCRPLVARIEWKNSQVNSVYIYSFFVEKKKRSWQITLESVRQWVSKLTLSQRAHLSSSLPSNDCHLR